MNLEVMNKWLSVIANVGVLAGIVFLAYEIQQNTLATELEVASNFQNSFSDIEMLIAGDTEFSEILIKGRTGAEMTDHERFRLAIFYGNVLRHWQYVHYQYSSDALDEDMTLPKLNALILVATPHWGKDPDWSTSSFVLPKGYGDRIVSISPIHLVYSADDKVIPISHLSYYLEELPWAETHILRGVSHTFIDGDTEVIAGLLEHSQGYV